MKKVVEGNNLPDTSSHEIGKKVKLSLLMNCKKYQTISRTREFATKPSPHEKKWRQPQNKRDQQSSSCKNFICSN